MADADDDLRQDLAGIVLAELRAGRTRLSPPAVAALRILGGEPRRSPEPRPARRGRLGLATGAAAAVIAGGAVLAPTAGDQQSAPDGPGPAATALPAAAAPSDTTEPPDVPTGATEPPDLPTGATEAADVHEDRGTAPAARRPADDGPIVPTPPPTPRPRPAAAPAPADVPAAVPAAQPATAAAAATQPAPVPETRFTGTPAEPSSAAGPVPSATPSPEPTHPATPSAGPAAPSATAPASPCPEDRHHRTGGHRG